MILFVKLKFGRRRLRVISVVRRDVGSHAARAHGSVFEDASSCTARVTATATAGPADTVAAAVLLGVKAPPWISPPSL